MIWSTQPVAVSVLRKGINIKDILHINIRVDEKSGPSTRHQWFWKFKDVFRLMLREKKIPAWYYDFDTLKVVGQRSELTFIRDELLDMW